MLLLTAYGTPTILRILCLLIGIFCAYQVVIIAKISTYLPEHLSGMAAAFANMMIMSFGSIFHTLIAKIMESSAGNIITEGTRTYKCRSLY